MKKLLALLAVGAVFGSASVFAEECGGCCGKEKQKEKPKESRLPAANPSF